MPHLRSVLEKRQDFGKGLERLFWALVRPRYHFSFSSAADRFSLYEGLNVLLICIPISVRLWFMSCVRFF